MDDLTKSVLLHSVVEVIREHIEPLFVNGAKISVIVRIPGNNEADVLVSSDTLDELAAVIERSRSRQQVG